MEQNYGFLKGKELEDAIKGSYDYGEGMFCLNREDECTILNTATGKWRRFATSRYLLVSDDDIDFDAIEKGCPHYERPYKYLNYGGLGRWDNFKDGICALSWRVYPDGRYFADEDGYGMEDNNEENAYCIIDRDLNVIVPFQPYTDIRQTLKEMRLERKQNINE